MLTVTPQAAEQIGRSAAQSGAGGACLRLAARLDDKGVIEYGMGFDDPAEGDARFESAGVTLDYVELNPGEWRFIFVNPNDPSHKAPKPER